MARKMNSIRGYPFVFVNGCEVFVFCGVGTEVVSIFQRNMSCQMTVSRRVVTAESRVRSQASSYEICGVHGGTGTGFFLPVLRFFSCQYHSISASHSSLFMLLLPEEQDGVILGNFRKAMVFQKSGNTG